MSRLEGNPITRIRSILDQLSGTSLELAKWLLDVDPARDLSTGEIARAVKTTRSTVVRFCQRLGYSGFPEFKLAWTRSTIAKEHERRGGHERFPPGAQRVIDMTRTSIAATVSTVDSDAFEQAVQAICNASQTIWVGLPGDAALVAASGEFKMTRAARQAKVISDEEGMRSAAEIVAPGDAVIVISNTGRWRWLADRLGAFRERGCKVVVVSGHPESVVARAADILLFVPVRAVTLRTSPLAVRAAQWMVVDMLTLEATDRLGQVPLQWSEPELTRGNEPA